ncbi:unnamed protein product [Gordionus sp. m RMFG-2023]
MHIPPMKNWKNKLPRCQHIKNWRIAQQRGLIFDMAKYWRLRRKLVKCRNMYETGSDRKVSGYKLIVMI